MHRSDCVNCGHSHTYDGPMKPYKPVDTPCWKCGCDDYEPESYGSVAADHPLGFLPD